MKKIVITVLASLFLTNSGFAKYSADIFDKNSLQRGAKYFVNYCAGCHSLKFQRYNRTFKDLGIDPELGKQSLIFTGAVAGEQMNIAMNGEEAKKWFSTTPPDLSLTARAKSADYIYRYLTGFYVDESRPLGFNNLAFNGASMPNPLWQLEGLKEPVFIEAENCDNSGCKKTKTISELKIVEKGSLSAEEYRQVASDLTNFLSYVSDPSALKRAAMGPWVLLFCFLLTLFFYLLKREYWRDIHK